MSLTVVAESPRPELCKLSLTGRLDTNTAPDLDKHVESAIDGGATTIAFDLAELDYISSAGLRTIFRAQKAMKQRGGSVCVVHMQPQVEKVFDIVKAMPKETVFASWAEMDAYLDGIQKRMIDGE